MSPLTASLSLSLSDLSADRRPAGEWEMGRVAACNEARGMARGDAGRSTSVRAKPAPARRVACAIGVVLVS